VRPADQIAVVARLAEQGLNNCEIARQTGIPRTTVRDWRRSTLAPGGARARAGGCRSCGAEAHAFDELPPAYAYLLGLYLGDGCVSRHPRGVYRLRITLDARYPVIVTACREAVQDIMPANRVALVPRLGCVDVSCYSKQWPCLLPQHGQGRKHERRIMLTDWQRRICDRDPELLIRGLIHSDGCRSINRVRGRNKVYECPRYLFTNHSADIRAIFCRYCDLLGIAWRPMGWKRISVARREAVAKLDAFVGPKA
jgi:Homeodomain-like domain